ncbi:MAG: tripartite tricarboxylate transporter substrate-binding protein [Candidatus Ornithospirochaeta sp.]
MKKTLVILLLALMAITGLFANGGTETTEAKEWKPEQPITIMNHVAVGGAMDLYSRKWVEIAAKYTDATFVVDNNSGAGGLTAGEWVLNQDADGYTVFALAPTYLDTVIQSELECSYYVDGFEYIYNLMADPYCVLVPTSSQFQSFEDLIAWARQGNLITLSEPNYGAKYIDAVQVFGSIEGVQFKAISYESAKNNFAALLGGQTVASVGNPGDTNKYDVRALVVGSKAKVPGLESVPSYADLGMDPALDEISMWRGYAVKKGTPSGMIEWFQDLCDKVSADPEWIEYMGNNKLTVLTDKTEAFTATVEKEVVSTIDVLKSVEQISADYQR